METQLPTADIVMLGTFSAWNLGTIQARALPLATGLNTLGVRVGIVVTPWDRPAEAGVIDVIDGVPIINTSAVSATQPLCAIHQQIQWVRALSPAVVHVFKPKGFGGFAGRVLAHSRPLVVDSDDWEGDGGWNDSGRYNLLQRRVFRYQEFDLLKRADFVTAASSLLANRARDIRANDVGTVKRVPNGITRERWGELSGARRIAPASIDPPVVLLYSRFAEFESDWLVSFVNRLSKIAGRNVTVRVVGDSECQTSPPAVVGPVHIEMLGYVAWSRVPDLLATSSVAVYPYRDTLVTRSKQSVKLLEQMAAGCPIIASDVGDIAETLGSAGMALPDAEPEQFARSVVTLLNQPERLNRMGETGTERIRSGFLFEDLARGVLDVYRRAGLRH